MLCSIFWKRSKFYSLLRAFNLRSSSYWKQSTGSENQWTGFYMVETSAMNELKKHSIYQVSSVYTANFKTLCANKVQPLKNISEGTKSQELDILNQLCNASIISEIFFWSTRFGIRPSALLPTNIPMFLNSSISLCTINLAQSVFNN